MGAPSLLTIGHSTRSIDEFLRLLQSHTVQHLVDIRTVPRSGHNPQFNRERLSAALAAASIQYSHLPGLGGFRHARADSPNMGWRNKSFRGYADYMQTEAFCESLQFCIEMSTRERVVLMCAEGVPWRCHRSLIADALMARGIQAGEIASAGRVRPHLLTAWARVNGREVIYPASTDGSTVVSD
jgi:uncharacterized protein (DUF488 family)